MTFNEWALGHEPTIRLGAFFGMFALMAIWEAVARFDTLPELMNVGPGEDYSIDEYYDAIAEVVGYSGRFVHDLTKPSGTKQKLLAVGRMKEWGFAPARSLREGMRLAYDYYLNRPRRPPA